MGSDQTFSCWFAWVELCASNHENLVFSDGFNQSAALDVFHHFEHGFGIISNLGDFFHIGFNSEVNSSVKETFLVELLNS